MRGHPPDAERVQASRLSREHDGYDPADRHGRQRERRAYAQEAPGTEEVSELITLPEAARRLNVNPKLLRIARDLGSFPVYKLGKRWGFVRMDEVESWVRSRIVVTGSQQGH